MHKERIQMLYAFEQLIINTEDFDEEEYIYEDRSKGAMMMRHRGGLASS